MFDKLFNMSADDLSIIHELTRNQGITDPDRISWYLNVGRVLGKDLLYQRMSSKPFKKEDVLKLKGRNVLCSDGNVRTIINIASNKGYEERILVEFSDEPNAYLNFNSYGEPLNNLKYRIYIVSGIDIPDPNEPVKAHKVGVPEYLQGIPLLSNFEDD